MKLTLKDNYSLQEVLKINRLIDGAIAIADIKGKAAICQGGRCSEVGCRICPFRVICCKESDATGLRIVRDCFNSFINNKYFQIRNGINMPSAGFPPVR